MQTIAAVATAVPPHVMPLDAVKDALGKVFDLSKQRLAALRLVADNTGVAQRYSVVPMHELMRPRSLGENHKTYARAAVELGTRATLDALARAGLRPREIDLLVTVSCTGVMIPSLDAHLINDLGFRPDVKRLPITELGCAAGAAGLARARDFVRAYPGTTALVVAVETPSLTFQLGDLSQANLVSCLLFGDGAAAAVVTGRDVPGARIVDTESYLFPNTLDAMGFDLRDTGFHIVLSREVPELVKSEIRARVTHFLGRHELTTAQLASFVLHPGGRKLLANVESELGLTPQDTAPSWDVLRDYGNLSSASVLFVLREWQSQRPPAVGSHGLLAAFGPGFSLEMLLLKWA